MKKILFVFFNLLNLSVFAQSGGQQVYRFLLLPGSAHQTALGDYVYDTDDIQSIQINPALNTEAANKQLAYSAMNYFSDSKYGFLAYGNKWKNRGHWGIALKHVNYGDFTEMDEFGLATGNTFSGGDYALYVNYAQPLQNNWGMGVNLKPVFSNLANYQSFGLLSDVGIMYNDTASRFTFSASINNIGTHLSNYSNTESSVVPFQINAGISKKLKHAPFRYSITFHNLQQPDLSFYDANDPDTQVDLATGEPILKKIGIGQKALMHTAFGVQMLLGRHFNINVGYNHLRRTEMLVSSRPSTVGFSFGVGLKISKLYFTYGTANYSLAGATHQFTFAFNLNEFKRRVN
jgi:hypothetical protein